MKQKYIPILTLLLTSVMLLTAAACTQAEPLATTQGMEIQTTESKPVEAAPTKTEPAETQPAETQPAETQPTETQPTETQPAETQPAETQPAAVSHSQALKNEAVVLPSSGAAMPNVTTAVASGTKVKRNGAASIDYSNTADGYVMVYYAKESTQRLKVQVKDPPPPIHIIWHPCNGLPSPFPTKTVNIKLLSIKMW